MKKIISILLLFCILCCGCAKEPEYYNSPKDAYLASHGDTYTVTDMLDRTIELDDTTVLWVSCVDSLVSGVCLVSAVCKVKDGKYTLSDTYESDVSYMKLGNVLARQYSESAWEHTASDTHDHFWQWVSTENSITTQIKGATAYDYSFDHDEVKYNVSLFLYSIEK